MAALERQRGGPVIITFGLGQARLREFHHDERNMFFSDWVRSYREAAAVHGCPSAVYDKEQRALIDRLLARRDVSVICAVNPEDQTQVYGWCCAEPGIVHYLYVKSIYRQHGLATAMLATATTPLKFFTHNARRHVDKLAAAFGAHYNPYLLHRGDENAERKILQRSA